MNNKQFRHPCTAA